MQTPSHFLMTATFAKAFPRLPIGSAATVRIVKSAFLWGSVAPDLALWGLSIGGIIYYHFMLGWSMEKTGSMMFDHLFFHHPLWILSHNLLHAPILLLIGLGLTWQSSQQDRNNRISQWFFWFFIACLAHSTIDILTHVEDGMLVFFPFDWTTRFHSLISYYDDRYYGREFSIFERFLNLFFLVYLLYFPISRYFRKLINKL
jgi:LexA-binding, inner membrane-associated putative hydrolase